MAVYSMAARNNFSIWSAMRTVFLVGMLIGSAAAYGQVMTVKGHLPDLQFALVSDENQPMTEKNLRGDIVLLYFGFTHCPAECPATMNRLANLIQQLGKDASSMRVLFVTVDPRRDTPQQLHAYLQSFDPQHMVGLTGEESTIGGLAKRYRVLYSPEDGKIAHSDSVYVFDRHGQAQFLITPQDTDAAVLQQLRNLAHE